MFQHIKVSISNSMVPFSYAKKRIVKPHQRCSDPTLVFLSLFFMYFSRKKSLMAVNQDWKMVNFTFLWYCKVVEATFQRKTIGDQNISFAPEGDIRFLSMYVFHTILSIWAFVEASYQFGRSKWLFPHIKYLLAIVWNHFHTRKKNCQATSTMWWPDPWFFL